MWGKPFSPRWAWDDSLPPVGGSGQYHKESWGHGRIRRHLPKILRLNLTFYSEFLTIFYNAAAKGLAPPVDFGYGWSYSWCDPLASKTFELYKFYLFGTDMSIPAFSNALNLSRNHSIDEILAQQCNVVPVEK